MIENTESLSRPPTSFEYGSDWAFRRLTLTMAILCIGVVVVLVAQIALAASPAIRDYGAEFLTSSKWSAKDNTFGIAPQIGGTLYSSILGVALGTFFGVAVAVFLTQDFLPYKWAIVIKNIVELLAAIPSVVYGLWGIFVLIPLVRGPANWLHSHFGGFFLFDSRLSGPGLLPSALVLAIMVLPTVTAISRDAIAAVPHKLREAAYGLGATRWEAVAGVILPTASRGIYGSIILAFGRAVGETMALAMLFGNTNTFSWSLFAPGNTLAALMANQWSESSDVEKGALMYAGLVLLGITLAIDILGTLLIMRTAASAEAKR
jgi:phosphate transport system permease protein